MRYWINKLYLLLLLIVVSCLGCRDGAHSVSTSDSAPIQVAVLRGPSVIALADWLVNPPQIGGKAVSVQVFDAPDRVQAALIKGEADVAIGARVAKMAHLANISCRVQREVRWDDANHCFIGDAEATALAKAYYRAPWTLPTI